MNKLVLFIALSSLSICASARSGSSGGNVNSGSHYVSGHTTKNGTYVAPSHATNPNGTKQDNYSQKGNVNPYTGKQGTKQ